MTQKNRKEMIDITRMEQDQLAAEVGMEALDKEATYNPANCIVKYINKGENQNGNTLRND